VPKGIQSTKKQKTNIMEVKETIKTQFGISQLEQNYNSTIELVNNLIKQNGWVVSVNGKSVSEISIHHYFDFGLSLNKRKQLAKKMYFANKKNTINTINLMFWLFKKLGVTTDSVRLNVSVKEQDIVRKRKAYKELQKKTEVARLDYKTEKGDFYKKRLIRLGF
jgi:hypothetical protein